MARYLLHAGVEHVVAPAMGSATRENRVGIVTACISGGGVIEGKGYMY